MKFSFIERRPLLPLLGAVTAFILSRVLYDRAGIRFQGDTYLGYWQFIDPLLLKTDLWRSVFYLHSQPPLMNLLTGIVLQGFPTNHEEVFHILYFMAGLVLVVSIYFLGLSMRFPSRLAAIISAWFVISPGAVLYEHWLAYAYPLTALLTLAGVFLYQFIKTGKKRWGCIFFASLALIALTWSLFHIVWFFGVVIILLIYTDNRKRAALAALLPFILVSAWYGKNLLIVGEFTASSWAGMNLSRITTFRLSEKDRRQMVKTGELSKFALIPPFRNPLVYLKLLPDTPKTGIPVLDEPETSLGRRNHNHLVYVEASRKYLRDALQVVKLRPQDYIRSIWQSLYIYFHSPSDFDLTQENRIKTYEFDLWWNRIFYGQWQIDEPPLERIISMSGEHVSWWTVVVFCTAVYGSTDFLWRNRGRASEPENLLALFMIYNILFVSLAGNLMDIGENNRFRFSIDPFIYILFIFFVRNTIGKYSGRRDEKLQEGSN